MALVPPTDIEFLKRALALAWKRKGYTAPNPPVGAVVVRDGLILAEGMHWASGYPHAEVEALKQVQQPEGATIYVTLEPCCHYGKTPPCTDFLIEKKVKRVVYGFEDPNPKVRGRGCQRLKDAGVEVERMALEEIDQFYLGYQKKVIQEMCWLTGKLAVTRDGKIGPNLKSRFQISGKEANAYTHFRRNHSDALLTSVNTVRVDDPQMNVRIGSFIQKKTVWVLDRLLTCEGNRRIFQEAQSLNFIHGPSAPKENRERFFRGGCDLIELGEINAQLNLTELSSELAKKGYMEAWCEWGPRMFAAACALRVFDEVVLLRSEEVALPEVQAESVVDLKGLEGNYRLVARESLSGDSKEVWRLI